jgi:hypothetical protein
LSIIHRSLIAEKYVERGSPVLKFDENYIMFRSKDLHVPQGISTFLAFFKNTRRDLNAEPLEFVLIICNGVFRARISPDNGLAKGLAGRTTPSNGGLTLVGDPFTIMNH